jgi:flagellar hook-associated protein 3 FlgL
VYSGDYGQRSMQISDGRTIAVGDNGASIFQSVSPSESSPVTSAASTNTGSATISTVSTTDPGNTNYSSTYTIKFSSASDGSMQYLVSSDPPDSSLSTTPSTYTAGTAISFGGQKVTINGKPGDGDSFQVEPSTKGNTDIFATLDNLVAALKQPTGTAGAQATLNNALTTAGTKITNTFNNVLAAQTVVGGREQEVQSQQSALATSQSQNSSDIANLTSIDLVSSISSYELTQNSLQAAQMAFSKIQNMSLFNYLGS